ncbi:type II toxin-antitoxin system YafQ family toxin [Megamonas rupellensis]|uniref:type II toxin-antitoxin system YafQ family toxin n=1 Tax=Megamonas rupellensis TaxID=491921 RepID=UPI003C6D89A6
MYGRLGHQPSLERYSKTCYFSRQVSFVSKNPLHLGMGSMSTAKYKDHSLTGIYQDFRECHILPDWLLIYRIDKDILTLVLSRTGTHSDLF